MSNYNQLWENFLYGENEDDEFPEEEYEFEEPQQAPPTKGADPSLPPGSIGRNVGSWLDKIFPKNPDSPQSVLKKKQVINQIKDKAKEALATLKVKEDEVEKATEELVENPKTGIVLLNIATLEAKLRTANRALALAKKNKNAKNVQIFSSSVADLKEKIEAAKQKIQAALKAQLEKDKGEYEVGQMPDELKPHQNLPPKDQLNEKDDRCTRIAKRKYDVWPSAYASGAVVKCRQGKIWKDLKEAEEGIEEKIRQALRDEGGAAGMDALKKHVGKSQRIIVQAIEDMDDVGRHADGDYILQDGEEVDIVDEKKLTKAEKKKREEIAKAIEKDDPNMPMDKKMAIATATAKRVAESDDELEEKKKKRKKRKKRGYGGGYMFDTDGDGGDGGGMEEDLKKWFGRKGAKGSASGWVDCNSPDGKGGYKACGRQEGEKRKKYPACRPTPAACKQKGKGKKWGKKGGKKKQESLTRGQLDEMVQDFVAENLLGNGLRHHIKEGIPVHQNLYRVGTPCYFNMLRQARNLDRLGLYETQNEEELYYLRETELGEWAMFEGERVPLDFPMYVEDVNEKKDPPIGKPTKNTGGGKKYKVYVRNPKTGNVKKITYGDAKGGLKGNWNNAEARKSFAARHNCEDKKDRTKAGYWACRAHKDFGKNVPGRFW